MTSTRKELLRLTAMQQSQLDPRSHEALLASVEALETAIGDIRNALADRPEDLSLHQRLASAYRREATLVKRLKAI